MWQKQSLVSKKHSEVPRRLRGPAGSVSKATILPQCADFKNEHMPINK